MHEECTGHSIIIISSVLSAAYIEYSRERERTLIDDGYRRGISKEHYRPLESTWTGVHFHLRRSNNRLKVGVCLSTQHTHHHWHQYWTGVSGVQYNSAAVVEAQWQPSRGTLDTPLLCRGVLLELYHPRARTTQPMHLCLYDLSPAF